MRLSTLAYISPPCGYSLLEVPIYLIAYFSIELPAFLTDLLKLVSYFRHEVFERRMYYKYILPFFGCFFIFNSVFCWKEVLNLNIVWFYHIFPTCLVLFVSYLRHLWMLQIYKKVTLCFLLKMLLFCLEHLQLLCIWNGFFSMMWIRD